MWSGDGSPDFRVTCGNADLGAGCKGGNKADMGRLLVRMDTPSFGATINCGLFENGGLNTPA